MTDAVAYVHALVEQVLANTLTVVPAVLSLSVASAQSYVIVSGHVILYQTESWLVPVGAVNVCANVLSPFVAVVAPAIAQCVPPWQPLVAMLLVPVRFQADEPLSKPPLTTPPVVVPVMVKLIVAACEPEVAVPVTVSVYVPGAADEVEPSVSVELPAPLSDVGENEPVTPLGAPERLSDTVCAAPDVTAVVIVLVVEPPGVNETLVGFAAIEKSLPATAVTVSV